MLGCKPIAEDAAGWFARTCRCGHEGGTVDIFEVRDQLVNDYQQFTDSFVQIKDARLNEFVQQQSRREGQWPEPWVGLNPTFKSGGSVTDLIAEGLLHPSCNKIFRAKTKEIDEGLPLNFYQHQVEAFKAAATGDSYVLTTGTGSGKSLAYIVPIVDRILRQKDQSPHGTMSGVKAIVVYPMNALANSQVGELEKYLNFGFADGQSPVTFRRYTGQEAPEQRDEILRNPPDILLTNYVMLDLVLTRPTERRALVEAAQDLQFLVLDELHSYRGRQGADVAMLVRRLRQACRAQQLQCIGTSATMASGGTTEQRKEIVAEVASRLFGTPIKPERVIGETLVQSTQPHSFDTVEEIAALSDCIDVEIPSDYSELQRWPLASWVEQRFGLEMQADGFARRTPTAVRKEAADELAHLTGQSVEKCNVVIKKTLIAGAACRHPQTNRPLFAFRLHQFLSKGNSVYVTLEYEDERAIQGMYQVHAPGQSDKPLYAVAFCRECGQEYLPVMRTTADHKIYYQPLAQAVDSDSTGYLFISKNDPWPENADVESRLPAAWMDDGQVAKIWRDHVPRRVLVRADGEDISHEPDSSGTVAAFIDGKFLFCLNCGVVYSSKRGNDYTKLATLDREGRSSAISVLSESLVRSLRTSELPNEAKKLLTFVDNRQDASLQAGHFNDFTQMVNLRGALWRALAANPSGLTVDKLGSATVDGLNVRHEDYSTNPEAKLLTRQHNRNDLERVVTYRILTDLAPGQRLTMPSLEQTALLRIEYRSLRELADLQEAWDDAPDPFRTCAPDLRFELMTTLLDEMRRKLAIYDEMLTATGFESLKSRSRLLTEPWRIPPQEKVAPVGIAYPSSAPAKHRSYENLYFSGLSAMGRYFRRRLQLHDRDEAEAVIAVVLRKLSDEGILTPYGDGGYQIDSLALNWQLGDERNPTLDPIRSSRGIDAEPKINKFFQDLYKNDSVEFSGLRAAEHTAQVTALEREEREKAFREAKLPVLFCSPTMELGVDIAKLNIVGLRNVPPTPANYAQRSGRAGRSGDPALVVTYCATGNAHDQYYFRRPKLMVSGSVTPPRLDLTNESLVRSHIHSLWLAQTGATLGSSMIQVLETSQDPADPMPVSDKLASQLKNPEAAARTLVDAKQLLDAVPELTSASWWHDEWLDAVINEAFNEFDRACDRWRQLYSSALRDRDENHNRLGQPNLKSKEQDNAKRRREQAEAQKRLLENADSSSANSDFYTYRYFASEGFLPGFSFPRLPLAAYIPGIKGGARGNDSSEYLQRPRFLAISEFGPNALIYHEGARYQVDRVLVPFSPDGGLGTVETSRSRVCEACGAHHEERPGIEICEGCGEPLGGVIEGLMRMTSVFTRPRDRISSDEEERRRAGFELATSYRFGGPGSRLTALNTESNGDLLAELRYGDSAEVRRTNLGNRRRKNPDIKGFRLDLISGRWQREDADPDDDEALDDATVSNKVQRVIPYVTDTQNILVLRWATPLNEIERTSLRYALERGIETAYELEDSELTSQALPDPDERGRMLFTEAAAGGAGVLRRLVGDAEALANVARAALELMHFDPDSGADLHRAEGALEDCELGCYDCLLSYGNQQEHSLINRHAAAPLLLRLLTSATTPEANRHGRTESIQSGLAETTQAAVQLTDLETQAADERQARFLAFLAAKGLRMPSQLNSEVFGHRVDFVYRELSAVLSFDATDEHEDLLYAGWDVVTVGEEADWPAVVTGREDIFGAMR